jgi:pimeloyl-ACP methyl ester carboxylesterase
VKRLVLAALAACAHPVSAPHAASAQLAVGDHVVVAGGLPTAYHVAGRGPLCVMVPGGPGLDWRYLRAPALEQQVTVLYVEPIGTGASGRLPAGRVYSFEEYAAQLEGLRAALQLDHLCLIGHSHAGMIALRYAIDHPARVAKLILYSSPSRGDAEFEAAEKAALAQWQDRPWYADAAKAMLEDDAPTDAGATRQWDRAVPLLFADWDPAKYGAAVKIPVYAASGLQPPTAPADFRPELAKITATTLVLVGAHDFCCGEPWGGELAAGIRGARRERFEHSGHMAHLEEPARFADVIARFVRGGS